MDLLSVPHTSVYFSSLQDPQIQDEDLKCSLSLDSIKDLNRYKLKKLL